MWPLDKTENRHGVNVEDKAKVEVAVPKLTITGLGAALAEFQKQKKMKGKSLRILIKSTK